MRIYDRTRPTPISIFRKNADSATHVSNKRTKAVYTDTQLIAKPTATVADQDARPFPPLPPLSRDADELPVPARTKRRNVRRAVPGRNEGLHAGEVVRLHHSDEAGVEGLRAAARG